MAENLVTIGFRGTEQYRTKLQREALDRGIKVQRLLEEAVAVYLDANRAAGEGRSLESPFGNLTPEEDRWLKAMLAYLRDEGHPFKENMLAIMASALGIEAPAKTKRKSGTR